MLLFRSPLYLNFLLKSTIELGSSKASRSIFTATCDSIICRLFKWNNLQLGFEYRINLYSKGQKLSDYQMSRTKFSTLFGVPDQYSNSGLIAGPPFEYWTSKSLLFRCFRYSDVGYSNPRCILPCRKNIRIWCLKLKWLHLEREWTK